MTQHQQRPTRQPDMDEIGINSFIIHNAKVRPWLKGEGVTVGNHFELLTWRREGLLARLKMRGFNVRTIGDRIRYLPPLPEPAPIGEFRVRELQHPKERYAYFDLIYLRWHEVEPGDDRKVRFRTGWVLRRRRGRGHADYYLAIPEKGDKIGLLPLSETDALLMGYAQATEHGERPITLERVDSGFQIPETLMIPPPHREVLKILTSRSKERGTVPPEGLSYLQELFGSLGLRLQVPESPPQTRQAGEDEEETGSAS